MKDEIEVDYSERNGMLVGKSAAMAEWRHRKEDSEYQKLFRRLYARNWQRLLRERDPERARAQSRRWREANPERAAENNRRFKRARRLRQLKAASVPHRIVNGVPTKVVVRTCDQCGLQTEGDRWSRFCGKKCANKWHGRAHTKKRNRGLRNMRLAATVLTIVEIEPGLTLGEIVKRDASLKYGSVATWICGAVKRGELVRSDGARWGVYRLPSSESEPSRFSDRSRTRSGC